MNFIYKAKIPFFEQCKINSQAWELESDAEKLNQILKTVSLNGLLIMVF
jgi:hypothetical protein